MASKKLSQAELKQIGLLVDAYKEDLEGGGLVRSFLGQISNFFEESVNLQARIHSTKAREKEPEHLRDKLQRKFLEAKSRGRTLKITPQNLFTKINDLAGIRLLHLHTHQFEGINHTLGEIFDEQNLPVIEGPIARTWDDEYRKYFESINVKTQRSDSMYTSVHYVISSASKTKLTCEVQVRTLAEELWGEVNHQINYPHPTKIISCAEQIKTLARATSTATRLVDSIYKTLDTSSE